MTESQRETGAGGGSNESNTPIRAPEGAEGTLESTVAGGMNTGRETGDPATPTTGGTGPADDMGDTPV